MLEVGGELDLGQEALGADHCGELGAKHLERHPPVVPEVLGQVDRRHAARADLAVETVAVGKRGLKPARAARASVDFVLGMQEDGGRGVDRLGDAV